jgi:hypothetical protein
MSWEQDAVANDPLMHMLLVSSDDVRVATVPRERRKAEAALPQGIELAPIGLLSRRALDFYMDDWHIVIRKVRCMCVTFYHHSVCFMVGGWAGE